MSGPTRALGLYAGFATFVPEIMIADADAHNGACRLERRPNVSIFQPNRLSVSGMSAQKARISA
jgi:hypothetical protein